MSSKNASPLLSVRPRWVLASRSAVFVERVLVVHLRSPYSWAAMASQSDSLTKWLQETASIHSLRSCASQPLA
jgi:hypothetical protein